MNLAVVGTGTGVGKTTVAARIALQLGASYWKPVATGIDDDDDGAAVSTLLDQAITCWPSAYAFSPPVSPHLAARQAGVRICRRALQRAWLRGLAREPEAIVLEGIGGVLVPLDDAGLLFADWLADTKLACVVVATNTLGTLNHTLLTLEALRARNIPIIGIALNGPADRAVTAEQASTLERLGATRVLGCLPWATPLDAEALRAMPALRLT